MRRVKRALWSGSAVLLMLPGLAQSQQMVTSGPQSSAAVAGYWTPARMAAAKPMPLRSATGTPVAAPASVVQAARTPGEAPSRPPAGAAHDAAVLAAAQSEIAPAIGPGSTIWYPYPPPGNLSIPILDYIVAPSFPNTALGKLFFSGSGGSFVCSAESVTSAGTWGAGNRQTVVTAGHCCSNGAGTFYSNWSFRPAYYNGASPLGSWTGFNATVYNGWHNGADETIDYCVLKMNTLGGQNVNDAVGALGYAWNQPLPQAYYATGWPQAAPFNGNLLYYSTASDAETDTQFPGAVPYTHGIGNQMTGGSSGGAWIRLYQSYLSGSNNQFNGLNAYKYTTPNRPAEMFGPYITDLFVSLLQTVATSPPAP